MLFTHRLGLGLCICALLGVSASHGSAQSRAFDCGASGGLTASNLKGVIAKVQDTYRTVESLRASFRQESFLSALEISEMSEGEMWFKRPGQMRWDYRSPERQHFILDKDTVYLHQPEERQVVIDRFDEVLISDLPVAFLMGLGELDRDFNAESGCRNSEGISVTLRPKKSGELASVTLLVAESTSLPRGARVEDISGNVTAILFEELRKNGVTPRDTFSASFPPGTDVQDRRGEKGLPDRPKIAEPGEDLS